MVAGPVTAMPGRGPPSWKFTSPTDTATQGLVVSGFTHLQTARALFLRFDWPAGQAGAGAWLADLETIAPVTDADGREQQAAMLALTYTGLERMGLDGTALASFSRPFREGMFQEDRSRRLGDRRQDQWLESVVPGGPAWSANTPQDAGTAVVTPVTVHALLVLYDPDDASGEGRASAVEAMLAKRQVSVVHSLPLVLDPNQLGVSSEHFGFADGLSQPQPYDDQAVVVNGNPAPKDAVNSVPLGEFLIGHLNGHHENAPGPFTPQGPAADASLSPHPLAEGFRDLGLNGSYMVVRELRQDVAAFWTSMAGSAAKLRAEDPAHDPKLTADWMAERVIGRNVKGNLLTPGGYLSPTATGEPDSDFLFLDRDPHGAGCPAGAHVRRANPRDSLAPTKAMAQTLLDAANNHRILRRGRKYGPKIADPTVDDGVDRGLLFMALNTDIARQFEFVQQTWLLNSNFNTLFDETDPLVGPAGNLTLRDTPLRRIATVDTFVRLAGGDYFFLPSMPALRYLATL